MPTPQRPFVLTLRKSDPAAITSSAPTSAPAAPAATITVTNPGNAPALPVFLVNGPVADELRFQRLDNLDRAQDALRRRRPRRPASSCRLDFNTRTLIRVSGRREVRVQARVRRIATGGTRDRGMNAGAHRKSRWSRRRHMDRHLRTAPTGDRWRSSKPGSAMSSENRSAAAPSSTPRRRRDQSQRSRTTTAAPPPSPCSIAPSGSPGTPCPLDRVLSITYGAYLIFKGPIVQPISTSRPGP